MVRFHASLLTAFVLMVSSLAHAQQISSREIFRETVVQSSGNNDAGAAVRRIALGLYFPDYDALYVGTRVDTHATLFGWRRDNAAGFISDNFLHRDWSYHRLWAIVDGRNINLGERYYSFPFVSNRTFGLAGFGAFTVNVGPIPVRVRVEGSFELGFNANRPSNTNFSVGATAKVYGAIMAGPGVGNTIASAGIGVDGWSIPADVSGSLIVDANFDRHSINVEVPLTMATESGVDLAAEWNALVPTNFRIEWWYGIPYLAADYVWVRQTARHALSRTPRETKNLSLYQRSWSF